MLREFPEGYYMSAIRVDRSAIGFAVAAGVLALIAGAAATVTPIIVVVPIAVMVAYSFAAAIGLEAAFLCFAIVAFSLPGFNERITPAVAPLTLLATFGLIVIAALRMNDLRVTPIVRVSMGIALAVSIFFAFLNMRISVSYAVTGWVSLVLPVAAAAAAAGSFTALRRDRPERFRQAVQVVLILLVFVVAINAILGLKQAFFGYTARELSSVLATASTYLVDGEVRPIGGYDSNQAYGLYMALLVPFVIFVSGSLGRKWRTFALVVGSLALVALVLSLLRGAALGGLVALMVGVFLPTNSHVRKLALRPRIAVPVILVLIGVVAYTQSDNPRWSAATSRLVSIFSLTGDDSYNSRLGETLPRAIAAFLENIWGLGGGASGPVSQAYSSVAPLGAMTTDNGYLNLGIQLGIVGGGALLVGLLVVAWQLLNSAAVIARSAGLIVVSLFVAMLFGGYWNLAGPMAIAGILVGVGLAHNAQNRVGEIADNVTPGGANDKEACAAAQLESV